MSLQLDLQPSHWMSLLLVLGHLLAGAALLSLPLPEWALLLLIALLVADLMWMLWSRAWLRTPDAWVAISVRDDEWVLRRRDGGEVTLSLQKEGLVTPWLTLLSLWHEPSDVTVRIMLFKDSLDVEAFRRLRILLRWGEAQRG